MDKVYEISLLIDFYGGLLTERQYDILDLHFNNDYSLGEIATELGITRQGVFDNIKRGRDTLTKMEDKLGLVKMFDLKREKAEQILGFVEQINLTELSNENKETINNIKNGIKFIIDND